MSKTCGVRPWLRIGSIVGAVLCISTFLPAAEHDLVMMSLSSTPQQLERGCSASLRASFLINGTRDQDLSTGSAAEIRFYWANAANPMPDASSAAGWNPAATLNVTWGSGDGIFAAGRIWPTEFLSVANSSASWTVPESATSFYLRAEVVYTTVTDDVPGNNFITTSASSVEGNCPGVFDCWPYQDHFYCFDIHPDWERLRCLIVKDCPPFLVDLCELCPRCCEPLEYEIPPFDVPWRILIGYPDEIMHVELWLKDKIIAESRPLEEPLKMGNQVYYQVMEMRELPSRKDRYGLQVFAGPKAMEGRSYPLIMNRARGKRLLQTVKED